MTQNFIRRVEGQALFNYYEANQSQRDRCYYLRARTRR
jgi:hypothetical protein